MGYYGPSGSGLVASSLQPNDVRPAGLHEQMGMA